MLNVQGSNYVYSNIHTGMPHTRRGIRTPRSRGVLPKSSLFIVARIAAGTAYMALATGTGLARLAGGERRLRLARHASGRGLR